MKHRSANTFSNKVNSPDRWPTGRLLARRKSCHPFGLTAGESASAGDDAGDPNVVENEEAHVCYERRAEVHNW